MKWNQFDVKRIIKGKETAVPVKLIDDGNLYRIDIMRDIATAKITCYTLTYISNGKKIGRYQSLTDAQKAALEHAKSRK